MPRDHHRQEGEHVKDPVDALRLDVPTLKKIDKCTDGLCDFVSVCSCCCLLGLVIPILFVSIVLSSEGTMPFSDYDLVSRSLLAFSIALFVCLTLVFCFSCRPLCVGGLCCAVDAPPVNTNPLPNQIEPQDYAQNHETDVEEGKQASPRKVYVIYNPFGGYGKSKRLLKEIVLPTFEKHGIEAESIPTEYGGHPTDLCRTLSLEGMEGIVIIGGDGSFFEAVNGLLKRPDGQACALGLIPGGTGNSFLYDYDMTDPQKAADAVVKGHTSKVDANKVDFGEDRIAYSINTVGFGLVGKSGAHAERFRWLGEARYDIMGLWQVLMVPSAKLEFSVDGEVFTEQESNGVFINHTQFFGKGLRAAPFSIQDDGKMEVLFLSRATRADLLKVFLLLKDGRHVEGHPSFSAKRAKEFTIKTFSPTPLLLDGETFYCESGIKITCVPHAFSFYHHKPSWN